MIEPSNLSRIADSLLTFGVVCAVVAVVLWEMVRPRVADLIRKRRRSP